MLPDVYVEPVRLVRSTHTHQSKPLRDVFRAINSGVPLVKGIRYSNGV